MFVSVAASGVAGFACGYEVVEVVCAASVVFDEVVCFGGWLAAPVALGVVGQQSSPVGEVGRVAGSFGHWLPPHFVRWVDASPSFLGLASSTIVGCVGGVVPPTLQTSSLGSRIE